jgi:GT2 family glycosyltransferase
VKVSAIIPNWNGLAVELEGRKLLPVALKTLQEQTHRNLEVIVVDNGSTDGSQAFIKEKFPAVRLVELTENIGFAPAMNRGVEEATGEYVAFLNNDMEFTPGFIAELVACLERHPRAAAVSAKQVLMSDHERVASAGGDIFNWYVIPYARGFGFKDRPEYAIEEQTFSASGGSSLWRRRVLVELGGFDPDFFAYFEDVDLGLRARRAGYECWYAPRAVVYHAVSLTGARNPSDFAFYHPTKNRWSLIIKNLPAGLFFRHLHQILFGDLFFFQQALRRGKFLPVLKGYAWVIRSLPSLFAKRRRYRRHWKQDVDLAFLVNPKFPPSRNRLLRWIAAEYPAE